MFEPIKKAMRRIRREYPGTARWGTGGAIAGAGFGALIVAGTGGGALILIPAAAATVGGTAAAFGRLEDATFVGDTMNLNGYRLVGEKKYLRAIYKTQQLVEAATHKYRHKDQVPEKVLRSLAPHIADMQAALQQVRVFNDTYADKGRAASFSFMRECYDIDGRPKQAPVGVVALALPPAPNTPSAANGNLADKNLRDKFPNEKDNAVQEELAKLRARIEQLEKPKGTELPKHKFGKQ